MSSQAHSYQALPLHPKLRRRIAMVLAPTMFGLAIVFLACIATLVVLWVDMPSISERTINPTSPEELSEITIGVEPSAVWLDQIVTRLVLVTWPLFWMEVIALWCIRPWSKRYRSFHRFNLLYGLIPPLRLCARNPDMGDAIWFPWAGWRHPDDELRHALSRFFGIPMLIIAILILPVLGIEFFMQAQVDRYPWLRLGLHISTGLIWFAFTIEFIVMVSAADGKLKYCKKHWLDLAIILLPLISFLRSLRILRATRLAKMTKVQQLTRMARVYRLRGVSTKALRALIVFDLLQRVLKINPKKRLEKLKIEAQRLEKELHEVHTEIELLTREIQEAEAAAEQAAEKSVQEI